MSRGVRVMPSTVTPPPVLQNTAKEKDSECGENSGKLACEDEILVLIDL